MNKKIFLFFILFIVLNNLLSQTNNTKIGLDSVTFKSLLNQQFTSLVTGQSKTSIGNFASIDLKETEVSFSGNSITENGHVIGLKVSGGVNDGMFDIFKNSTLNTKISIEANANFLNLSNQSLMWYDDSYQDYVKKRNDLEDKYRIKHIETEKRLGLIILNYKKNKIKKNMELLNQRLGQEKDSLILDSLNYAIAFDNSELIETEKFISNYPNDISIMEDLDNWRAIELKKIKPELELYGFKFGWFSMNYKISNNCFKLFNPSQTFDNQISDASFVCHEIRLQYNMYNWTKEAYKTYFYCVGITFSITDNFNDLSKKEINEVHNYGPNVNDRMTVKKFNAYTGDYKKGLFQIKLNGDYYHFLFESNVMALHIYPEFSYKQPSQQLLYNFGIGFLYSFKDNKIDDKSNINVELFYNFIDITKNTMTELKLFERNNIGIRFTFPINFVGK